MASLRLLRASSRRGSRLARSRRRSLGSADDSQLLGRIRPQSAFAPFSSPCRTTKGVGLVTVEAARLASASSQ